MQAGVWLFREHAGEGEERGGAARGQAPSDGGNARYVLADDVEFDVDCRAYLYVTEIGVLEGIGDDGHTERIGGGIAHGKADAVDTHGTFLHGDISLTRHFGGYVIAEFEIAAAVHLLDVGAQGGAVHVALDDVAVKTAVHHHAAFHVHAVARLEQAEVTAAESLLDGCDGVGVAGNGHDSKADAVMGHRLVDFQLVSKRASECEMQVAAIPDGRHNGGGCLNDSGKHMVTA